LRYTFTNKPCTGVVLSEVDYIYKTIN